MENLILIGMPSSGKSTIGPLLAERLSMEFLDTDRLLVERAGESLADQIAEVGETAFLGREGALLAALSVENTVVATGGSAVYSDEGMKNLGRLGRIVYLAIDEAEVRRRVGDLGARGVIYHGNYDLAGIYSERTRLYRAYADLTVDITGLTVKDALAALLVALDAPLDRA